jgi:lipid-binding SYLF domain-containing protein
MAPAPAGGGGPSVIASASDASCAPKESDMKRLSRFAILLPIFLAACASGSGQGDVPTQPVLAAAEVPKVKAGILTMRDKTLDELYAQKPETREEVKKAIGYAVFDSSQINVVLFVGARGTGVLVDNATQANTFMLATRAGTGPGLGYKDFRQVMIFKNKEVFDQFRKLGADVTASADATMKLRTNASGTSADLSASFNPFISTYQFTDQGLLLQANWGGAAFVPYAQLNQP